MQKLHAHKTRAKTVQDLAREHTNCHTAYPTGHALTHINLVKSLVEDAGGSSNELTSADSDAAQQKPPSLGNPPAELNRAAKFDDYAASSANLNRALRYPK